MSCAKRDPATAVCPLIVTASMLGRTEEYLQAGPVEIARSRGVPEGLWAHTLRAMVVRRSQKRFCQFHTGNPGRSFS